MKPIPLALALSLSAACLAQDGATPIRMPADLALSPDGSHLAFTWRGDVWIAPSGGGEARALTTHPAADFDPAWSPDGREIAFTSDRGAGRQVHVVPAEGGNPVALTVHSEGYSLVEWSPDGTWLLATGAADTRWDSARRLWKIPRKGDAPPQMLFDESGGEARIAPDGKRVAFVREGGSWWRKGYRGSAAGQVWLWEDGAYTCLLKLETECRWPMWRADGQGVWYVGAESGSMNLRELDLATGETRALTKFEDDSVVIPCASRDGSTIAFRRLFDIYRFRPGKDDGPQKLGLWCRGDAARPRVEHRTVEKADAAAFTADGLEVAFTAGGDVWVMDTILREPRRVTNTHEEERGVVFSTDGSGLLFVSDAGGRPDLWRADRAEPSKYWWRNESFRLRRLTDDAEADGRPRVSPDGKLLAWIKGRGDLWVASPDGRNARRLFQSWNPPEYDWSPDGRWIAYTVEDDDYNADVWIRDVEGKRPPVNISRHPDNEGAPAWSPDGRILAFTGRRHEGEVDIFYCWLRVEDDEREKRERTLEEALEKMKKERKAGPGGKPAEAGEEAKPPRKPGEKAEPVRIDFDGIHERLRRISIPDANEGGLFWKWDSKRLAFTATIKGVAGVHAVDFPDPGEPKLVTNRAGSGARWIEQDDQIVMLADNAPGAFAKGAWKAYPFSVRMEADLAARRRAGFVMAWRLMRDHFYDDRMNNRDWNAIRAKYEDMAAAAQDSRAFTAVVNLMLGELNASHLGFGGPDSDFDVPGWRPQTAWLGLRWDPSFPGPGLRVASVVPDGPAARASARLDPGDIVLEIDRRRLGPGTDVNRLLTGPPDRDIRLEVLDAPEERVEARPRRPASKLRELTLRSAPWAEAGRALYKAWVEETRAKVEALSGGALGYVHIRGMDWGSFQQFERDLYAAGVGRDGLVIDVRDNGGGFTADHLLTVLTAPRHAATLSRGSGPGYPQDRRVYATWDKPVVVLINQNSFSNAEIFAHAIRTLKRGKLVGVRTAGGVISTGAAPVMDLGFLRMPTRGWFVTETGEDMELNGAAPDVEVWPQPGDAEKGIDRQVEKGVDVLLEEVRKWKERKEPGLRKASERK